MLLSIIGLIGLVYGIVVGGDHGFGRVDAWGSIVGGIVVLGAFVWWERRVEFPSLDVKLFRNPRFSASVGAVGLVFFAAMGTLFFMAFYLQLVRGYSPLESGLLYLPFAAAQLIFAPRSATYGPPVRAEGGLCCRSGHRRRRHRRLPVPRREHADLGARRAVLLPGPRHGQRDAAGH